jgi:hypothetical protein
MTKQAYTSKHLYSVHVDPYDGGSTYYVLAVSEREARKIAREKAHAYGERVSTMEVTQHDVGDAAAYAALARQEGHTQVAGLADTFPESQPPSPPLRSSVGGPIG